MNTNLVPSTSTPTGSSLTHDPMVQSQFYQPPSGGVEIFLAPMLSPEVVAVESAYGGLVEDGIDNGGTGPEAVQQVISEAVFAAKLHSEATFSPRIWDGWVMLTLKARFYSVLSRQETTEIRPSRIADIHPTLESSLGAESIELIEQYRQMFRDGEDLGTPLYITGECLSQVGANPFVVSNASLWNLDGAKRIMARILNHDESILIKVIVTESQYSRFLLEDDRSSLKRQIHSLTWFNDYQSIPLVGFAGQRSSARYQLIDTSVLRGKRVLDFGCNLGQACLKAAQAGATEVFGLDVMPDTLAAAEAIHSLCPFPNLSYHQINFNDPDFPTRVDQLVLGQVDYSFFFSVYRTQELTQRDVLLQYILDKSRLGVFFEGHGDETLDSLEVYAELFERFGVQGQFLGYSENGRRPLYFIDRSGSSLPHVVIPTPTPVARDTRAFGWGSMP